MINLGRHSGKGWPNHYIPRQAADYILEGITIILLAISWALCIVPSILEGPSPETPWVFMGVFTGIIALLLLMLNRISTKHYNFPVRIHEGNIVNQLFLAHRFIRILALALSLIPFVLVISTSPYLAQFHIPSFDIMVRFVPLLIFPILIVYFIIANKYK